MWLPPHIHSISFRPIDILLMAYILALLLALIIGTMSMLKEYELLKVEAAAIEEKIEALKGQVLEEVKAQGGEVDGELGKFVVVEKKSYAYSPKVKKIEEVLKLAKLEDERSGKAQLKLTEYVAFKITKI